MSSHVRVFNKLLQGATLQTFNAELIRSLEGLQERRKNIIVDIKKEEERKKDLEQYIIKLQAEIETLNELLERKIEIRNEFEKTISNTEGAYKKVKYYL